MTQLVSKSSAGTLGSFLLPERVGFPFPCLCNPRSEGNTHSGEQQLHRQCTRRYFAKPVPHHCASSSTAPGQPPAGPHGFLAGCTHPHTAGVPAEARTAPTSSLSSSSSCSPLPHQTGEAGCEGRKNALAFQVLTYKKEAQELFFPELCTAMN